jgi:hypothetical protein
LILQHQLFLGLHHLRIQRDALHGAHLNALRLIKVTHAFGAFVRINFIDLLAKIDGLVGALGFTNITIDALTGDHQSHKKSSQAKDLEKKVSPFNVKPESFHWPWPSKRPSPVQRPKH